MRWFSLFLLVTGAAVVAVTPSPSSADSCVVRNHAVYQQAVVTQNYGYNNVVHHGYQTYYPKVVEIAVAPDYYYSVGEFYRLKLLSDSIVGRILEAQAKGQAGVQPTNPSPGGGIVPTNPMTPFPPVNGGSVRAGLFQDEKLIAVVNQSCASCHNSTTAKGGFIILTDDGKLADLDVCGVAKVFHQVATGRMPRGGKPLQDDVMPLFDQWVTEVSKLAKK